MSMSGKAGRAVVLLAVCLVVGGLSRVVEIVAAAEDPHAFFNALVLRSDHWRSYSFRNPVQLSGRDAVTYEPASDGDRHRQDAAKVVVPAFFETTTLVQPIATSSTMLTLESAYKPLYPRGRVIKIDQEIMTVAEWLSDTTVSVNRGANGTAIANHSAGATVMHSTNSLKGQVRVPLATEDQHDYFFTWDSYWTDSFIGAGRFNHKAFQFSSGGRDGDTIWMEPNIAYGRPSGLCGDVSRYVGSFGVRFYNRPGGDANWSLTDGNMLGPLGQNPTDFCVEPNTWVRFFIYLQQRANDYDLMDMWVADERREPVQIIAGQQISVRPTGATPNSIAKFWIEFNSSEDELFRFDGRDLVAYVRNFVALRDLRDPRALLVRPVPGAEPQAGPEPPVNVRILR